MLTTCAHSTTTSLGACNPPGARPLTAPGPRTSHSDRDGKFPLILSSSFECVGRSTSTLWFVSPLLKMDKERLIEEVRKYTLLYDSNDSRNNDIMKKDDAWKSIGKTLSQPAILCKKSWANLREAHRRAIKKKTTNSNKKWQYEEEMSFLLPHCRERRTLTSNLKDIEMIDVEESHNSGYTSDHPEYFTSFDHPDSIDSTSSIKFPDDHKSVREGKEGNSSASAFLMKYLKELKDHKSEDDIDKFFSCMALTVKKFSSYNQAILKSKIFNMVSQMELQELSEKQNDHYDNNYQPIGPSGHNTSLSVNTTQQNETTPTTNPLHFVKFELP